MVYSTCFSWNDFNIYGQIKTFGKLKKFGKSIGVNYTPSFLPFLDLSFSRKEFAVLTELKDSYTFGAGLHFFDLSFDYAYEASEYVALNHKHYFSIGLSF